MKKEKSSKYSLLKVLGITFLIFAVLTWFIPAGYYSESTYTSVGTNPVGLFGLFINPLYSFGIFVQYIVVFLAIGGLYGVMNKTGVYSKLVEGVCNKVKNKKCLFLIITMIGFILLSSLVGSQVALFVFVPLFVAILMTLGYDKVTALAATVGSILVGFMGSTYGTGVIFKSFLGLDANNGIIYKIIFLVIIAAVYILFILRKNKCSKVEQAVEEKPKRGRKKVSEVLEKVEEKVKKVNIPLYYGTKGEKKNKKVLPLAIILIVTAILIFVGVFNWYYTFGIEVFNKLHESIMSLEVGNVAIIAKVFGELPQIGEFGNYDLAAILIIVSALIAWIYGIKFNDLIESFTDGAKKMLLPAIYVMFASIIFAVMVNSTGNISIAITNFLLGLTSKFNVIIVSLVGLIGSYFYNDFPYLVNGIYGALANYDVVVYPIISIILNATYGLAMLVLPVSITLIAGLKYMDVSYKEWIKYIWKFLLCACILTIVFALIAAAII